MLSFRKPCGESLRHFLAAQAKLDFSYGAVGATADESPLGYVVDHTRIQLGEGEAVFKAARSALENWEQFRLGWVEAWPPDTRICAGEVVAVIGRAMGLWWLNASRTSNASPPRARTAERSGRRFRTDRASRDQARGLKRWRARMDRPNLTRSGQP